MWPGRVGFCYPNRHQASCDPIRLGGSESNWEVLLVRVQAVGYLPQDMKFILSAGVSPEDGKRRRIKEWCP